MLEIEFFQNNLTKKFKENRNLIFEIYQFTDCWDENEKSFSK